MYIRIGQRTDVPIEFKESSGVEWPDGLRLYSARHIVRAMCRGAVMALSSDEVYEVLKTDIFEGPKGRGSWRNVLCVRGDTEQEERRGEGDEGSWGEIWIPKHGVAAVAWRNFNAAPEPEKGKEHLWEINCKQLVEAFVNLSTKTPAPQAAGACTTKLPVTPITEREGNFGKKRVKFFRELLTAAHACVKPDASGPFDVKVADTITAKAMTSGLRRESTDYGRVMTRRRMEKVLSRRRSLAALPSQQGSGSRPLSLSSSVICWARQRESNWTRGGVGARSLRRCTLLMISFLDDFNFNRFTGRRPSKILVGFAVATDSPL